MLINNTKCKYETLHQIIYIKIIYQINIIQGAVMSNINFFNVKKLSLKLH